MSTFLQVEPIGSSRDENDLVYIDEHAMAHEGLSEGDIVEIQSNDGRTAIARVGAPIDEDHDTGYIRIGKSIRGSVKVSIGDTVEVEASDSEPLSEITFAPLSDVSGIEKEELDSYLKESFKTRGTLVNEGTIEYVSLPGQSVATGFKILSCDPESGIVESPTEVSVEYAFDTWGTTAETTFEDIGGLDEELQSVRELVEYPIRFPDIYQEIGINPARGVILFGPPGTGKTLMTRAISNELDAEFHYINGPGIISTGYGETEQKLRQIFEEARESLPSIILIDEIDAIAPKRDETGTFTDLRVVTQLLELMDGLQSVQGVMVVATTNRIDEIEPALRRPGRFDREVYVGPPDEESREDIFRIHTRGMLLEDNFDEQIPELAEQMNGYTGADIRELVREAGVNALRRQFPDSTQRFDRSEMALSDLVVSGDDFQQALKTVQPSVLRGPLSRDTTVSLDEVGGHDEAKERLYDLVRAPLDHADTFDSMNINTSPGVLLTGPPGVGKTMLAKAAGHDFDVTFLQVSTSDIFSEWLGQSEKSIRQVFRIARRAAPTVVLIDNLDTIARSRDGDNDVADRVLNQLMNEIDSLGDHEVTIIGTTDRPDDIDEALLASNRFGDVIELSPPTGEERRKIIELHLADVETDLSTGDIDEIVAQTDGWVGAHLATLCENAKLATIRDIDYEKTNPVTRSELETALESMD